jgi:hypoxanthine phosphoribosyltransferase
VIIREIQAGQLAITLDNGQDRFDDLVTLASRENQKRSFLFVSRVLGKHIPVQPKIMRSIYDELADLCIIDSSTYVVGMAETATGLGAGVADSLSKRYPKQAIFYQHTTRYQLNHPIWFTLDESHSHAVDQFFYKPEKNIRQSIQTVKQLILVDDEITTGRTLHLLATKIRQKIPSIKKIVILSLVNWLSTPSQKAFHSLHLPIQWIHLIKGQFTFTQNKDFNVSLPKQVDDQISTEASSNDLGRIGLKMPYVLSKKSLDFSNQLKRYSKEPIAIIGTGEHLYYPFLMAEVIEKTHNVLFHSTTRSPILKGDAIQHKIQFDAKNGKYHFLYNSSKNRKRLIFWENQSLPTLNASLPNEKEE